MSNAGGIFVENNRDDTIWIAIPIQEYQQLKADLEVANKRIIELEDSVTVYCREVARKTYEDLGIILPQSP